MCNLIVEDTTVILEFPEKSYFAHVTKNSTVKIGKLSVPTRGLLNLRFGSVVELRNKQLEATLDDELCPDLMSKNLDFSGTQSRDNRDVVSWDAASSQELRTEDIDAMRKGGATGGGE